mgnify:FL=1
MRHTKGATEVVFVLWTISVLAIGLLTYFNKPWGHDLFVESVAGVPAHCAAHYGPQGVILAEYEYPKLSTCPKEHFVSAKAPFHRFMWGTMLGLAFLPPLFALLAVYTIATATRVFDSVRKKPT